MGSFRAKAILATLSAIICLRICLRVHAQPLGELLDPQWVAREEPLRRLLGVSPLDSIALCRVSGVYRPEAPIVVQQTPRKTISLVEIADPWAPATPPPPPALPFLRLRFHILEVFGPKPRAGSLLVTRQVDRPVLTGSVDLFGWKPTTPFYKLNPGDWCLVAFDPNSGRVTVENLARICRVSGARDPLVAAVRRVRGWMRPAQPSQALESASHALLDRAESPEVRRGAAFALRWLLRYGCLEDRKLGIWQETQHQFRRILGQSHVPPALELDAILALETGNGPDCPFPDDEATLRLNAKALLRVLRLTDNSLLEGCAAERLAACAIRKGAI